MVRRLVTQKGNFPASSPGVPPYCMMVRVALWDRCTATGGHPSHDASRSLFARAKPAPGDEAGNFLNIMRPVSATRFFR